MHKPWTTKKTIVYAIIFFLGLSIAFGMQRWYWPQEKIMLAGEELNVLVAKSIYQQNKGLGERESIHPYDGMLFPFVLLDKHAMVMRDMEFAIDIIWFYNSEVVDIASNIEPEGDLPDYALHKYFPRKDANFVLEVEAGWADKNGLKIGDKLEIVD